jgi:hypothetical protein
MFVRLLKSVGLFYLFILEDGIHLAVIKPPQTILHSKGDPFPIYLTIGAYELEMYPEVPAFNSIVLLTIYLIQSAAAPRTVCRPPGHFTGSLSCARD